MAALPPAKKTGSGFTNLQRILQANKGSQLGSTLASKAQQEAMDVEKGLGKASETFKKDVQSNALNTAENVQARESGLNTANSVTAANDVQNKIAPPAGTNLVDQFQKFRAGEYKGPVQLDRGAQFLNRAEDLSNLGQNVNTSEGRFGLLQRYLGAPQYTTGQKRLDNLLLTKQADPLKQIRQSTAGLQNEVSANLAQNQAIAQLQQQANQKFAADTRALLGIDDKGAMIAGQGQLGTLDKQMQDKLAAAQTKAGTDYNSLINAFKQPSSGGNPAMAKQFLQSLYGQNFENLPSDVAAAYRLSNQTWSPKSGVDLRNILQQGAAPTIASATSAQEQARLMALQQLAGIAPTQFGAGAGTYDPSKYYNLAGYLPNYLDTSAAVYTPPSGGVGGGIGGGIGGGARGGGIISR